MSATMGGYTFTKIQWAGPTQLMIKFSSGENKYYQAYAGREFLGVTSDPLQRTLNVTCQPGIYGRTIQLLGVDVADRFTDYGTSLPSRPTAKVRASITTSGASASAPHLLEIVAGDAPGEAVNSSNVVARKLFDDDRTYTVVTDELGTAGTYNLEARLRGSQKGDGNLGTSTAFTATISPPPEDFTMTSSGDRLETTVSGGTLTVTVST